MDYKQNYYDYVKYVLSEVSIGVRPKDRLEWRRWKYKGDKRYFEFHHVIPKCFGGEDSPENKIPLTGREHFLAHYLLSKFNPCKETLFAFSMMRKGLKNNANRYLNSRLFEHIKKKWCSELSKLKTGKPIHTDAYKDECRRRLMNNPKIYHGKKGADHPNYGKHYISEEGKEIIRQIRKQEGINRRSNSDRVFAYFFKNNNIVEYKHIQEFIEKNNVHDDDILNVCNRAFLNTLQFNENKVSLRIRPMINNSYVFIGNDIDLNKLKNYALKLSEVLKRGATWYNNGKQHKLLNECPEGWQIGKLGTIRLITYSKEVVYGNTRKLYQGLKKIGALGSHVKFKNFEIQWKSGTTFHDLYGKKYVSHPEKNVMVLI